MEEEEGAAPQHLSALKDVVSSNRLVLEELQCPGVVTKKGNWPSISTSEHGSASNDSNNIVIKVVIAIICNNNNNRNSNNSHNSNDRNNYAHHADREPDSATLLFSQGVTLTSLGCRDAADLTHALLDCC